MEVTVVGPDALTEASAFESHWRLINRSYFVQTHVSSTDSGGLTGSFSAGFTLIIKF
jgi:hypothetical protein